MMEMRHGKETHRATRADVAQLAHVSTAVVSYVFNNGPRNVAPETAAKVRAALEICRLSRTILGANGISLEYPVIRHANNLESVLTYEGTSEMHTLVIGEHLTGIAAYR